MARKRLTVKPIVVQIKLTLHIGEDDDLIAWFNQTPSRLRSAAVKAALRGGSAMIDQAIADDDTLDRLDNLIG